MNKKLKIVSVVILCFVTAFIVAGKIISKDVENSFKTLNIKVQNNFKDGDLIFQTSESEQCEAVRIATNSKFSHCGIIFKENGKSYVYEAIQPVKKTLLIEWIQHGRGSKYVVRRLKDSTSLTPKVISDMKNYGQNLFHKNYDIYFEWSDENIYCSEYVWKIYKNGANIELCTLAKLKSFNLDNPKVQTILKERYGKNIPYDEKVVAPSQLVESEKLVTVFDNY